MPPSGSFAGEMTELVAPNAGRWANRRCAWASGKWPPEDSGSGGHCAIGSSHMYNAFRGLSLDHCPRLRLGGAGELVQDRVGLAQLQELGGAAPAAHFAEAAGWSSNGSDLEDPHACESAPFDRFGAAAPHMGGHVASAAAAEAQAQGPLQSAAWQQKRQFLRVGKMWPKHRRKIMEQTRLAAMLNSPPGRVDQQGAPGSPDGGSGCRVGDGRTSAPDARGGGASAPDPRAYRGGGAAGQPPASRVSGRNTQQQDAQAATGGVGWCRGGGRSQDCAGRGTSQRRGAAEKCYNPGTGAWAGHSNTPPVAAGDPACGRERGANNGRQHAKCDWRGDATGWPSSAAADSTIGQWPLHADLHHGARAVQRLSGYPPAKACDADFGAQRFPPDMTTATEVSGRAAGKPVQEFRPVAARVSAATPCRRFSGGSGASLLFPCGDSGGRTPWDQMPASAVVLGAPPLAGISSSAGGACRTWGASPNATWDDQHMTLVYHF